MRGAGCPKAGEAPNDCMEIFPCAVFLTEVNTVLRAEPLKKAFESCSAGALQSWEGRGGSRLLGGGGNGGGAPPNV